MAERTKYEYSALDGETAIRLLELTPQSSVHDRDDRVVHTTWDQGNYEAISYCWGSDKPSTRIHLDRHGSKEYIRITEDLDYILMDLRHPTKVRRLWVDAICINQDDIPERNRLVPKMRDIYRNADLVTVCLGKERYTSENIPAIVFVLNQSLSQGEQKSNFAGLDARMLQMIKRQPQMVRRGDVAEDAWRTLRAWLYDRKWFRRVWVMQEVALAKNSVVRCGDWEIPGVAFFSTFGELGKYPIPFSIARVVDGFDQGVSSALEGTRIMCQVGAARAEAIPMPLMELLKRSRNAQATNERDRIYALLGIASETDLPPVEYDEPWQETYTRFALHLISKGHLADVLQNCFLNSESDELPTWVPNWHANVTHKLQIPYIVPGLNTYGYQCGGQKACSFLHDNTVRDILQAKGHIVATIKRVLEGVIVRPPMSTLYARFDPLTPSEEKAVAEAEAKAILEVLGQIRSIWGNQTDEDNRDLESSLGSGPQVAATHTQEDELYMWFTLLCAQRWDNVNGLFGTEALKDIITFMLRYGRSPGDKNASNSKEDGKLDLELRAFRAKALAFCRGNLRCVTNDGGVGQVPLNAMSDDVIAVFEGVPVPLVLRARNGPGPSATYQIVGSCYFFHLMAGLSDDTEFTMIRLR